MDKPSKWKNNKIVKDPQVCIYIYVFYISKRNEIYDQGDFSKVVNPEILVLPFLWRHLFPFQR